jgi:hypothetical protein
MDATEYDIRQTRRDSGVQQSSLSLKGSALRQAGALTLVMDNPEPLEPPIGTRAAGIAYWSRLAARLRGRRCMGFG